MDQPNSQTNNWPDLAIGLYDKLTGRGAEITYELHNLELHVPSSTSADAEHAMWKINGTVKIRTRDEAAVSRARPDLLVEHAGYKHQSQGIGPPRRLAISLSSFVVALPPARRGPTGAGFPEGSIFR